MNYAQRQAASRQAYLDIGVEVGMQKMADFFAIALNDPAVLGKSVLGKRAEQGETLAKTILGDLEREKAKRKKEIGGLTAFVGVGAALCVAGACWLAAPWWTAVAPMVLMVAVMRKAGWI